MKQPTTLSGLMSARMEKLYGLTEHSYRNFLIEMSALSDVISMRFSKKMSLIKKAMCKICTFQILTRMWSSILSMSLYQLATVLSHSAALNFASGLTVF